MRRPSWRLWIAALAAGLLPAIGGCASRHTDLRTQLESFDPADRIRAIRTATQRGESDLVPALVDRLDDDDPAVRMYAILALEKMTGERRGYRYFDPPQVRRQCIESWRAYIAERAEARQREAQTTGNAG